MLNYIMHIILGIYKNKYYLLNIIHLNTLL